MMKLSILYLLCIFMLSSEQLPAQESENAALFSRVSTFLRNGEPKKALNLLSDRIESTPDDIQLLTKRAEVNLILSRRKDVKKELRNILSGHDSYGPALLVYAQYHVFDHQLDSALWYIEKALTKENDSPTTEALYGLKGNILLGMEQFKDAEDNLVMAADRPEVSITTMRDLASVLSENSKDHEALAVLKETMLIFGERLEPLINAGFVCNRLGMYDEAAIHLKKALIQDPDQPFALANIAEAYLHVGSVEMAYKHIEKSIANDKLNAYAYKIRGDCLSAMQQPEKACKEYKRAYTMDYNSQYDEVPLIKMVNAICGNDGVVLE